MKERIAVEQVLELIKKLPYLDEHIHIYPIDGKHVVTNEWLLGSFAGRAFEGNSFEEATEKLIEYLYKHKGKRHMVGEIVERSGFPDLEKMYEYCKPKED